MNKILITGILFLFYTVTFAQYLPGARQISMGNSDVAKADDIFTLFNNPAGLSHLGWREVGIYYSPAPFGLSELANGYVAYNEPFSFGSIALGGMTYGYELYRETKILLGYSYNYENKFFGGIAINYLTTSIQNYGSDAAFYINLGVLAYLSERFRLGFAFENANRASIGNEKNQIPVVLKSGISYDLLEEFSFNIAAEKDLEYKTSFQFGFEYNIIEHLALRSGFSNEPAKYSAGVGINYSIFSLDYAFFTHQDLGLTHQAGLLISFGKEGSRNSMIRKHLGINSF